MNEYSKRLKEFEELRKQDITDFEKESLLYAEVYLLREMVKGPTGYETWQDAAVHERLFRIKFEEDLKVLAKEDRAIRRLLCVYASTGLPYMDDGEASCGATFPTIDFLRDSAEVIESKLRERNLKKLKEEQKIVVPSESSFGSTTDKPK